MIDRWKLYDLIYLLLGQRHKIPDNHIGIYSCYASKELQKAKDLFVKMFK